PVVIFEQEEKTFTQVANSYLEAETGWWFSIEQGDFDQDGDMDYVLGNLGLNYKYKASPERPFSIYAGDLDDNGNSDIVLSYYNDDTQFPVRGLQCSSEQMPGIKQKFVNYSEFAISPIEKVYGSQVLDQALQYQATNFASSYLENLGDGKFSISALPFEAQFSSVNDIIVDDIDGDDKLDLVIAGNLHSSEVETTRNDASIGLFLHGLGDGRFTPVPYRQSGLMIRENVKKLKSIETPEGRFFAVGNNDGTLQLIKANQDKRAKQHLTTRE
ncbi:MAG: VCBS repeat-containing protein, partial [Bacteroidota bacterium]